MNDTPRTVGDAIRQAVRTDDGAMALRAAQILRRHGFGYHATYAMARKLTGIGMPEWDALLYEGERIEATRDLLRTTP